ncbi:putative metal-dependent HD superfamily phosphohydrolase [Lewinella aquimaris]|uniref:Putative metal-dependent HD superfamily phosphohydrolase n=1 Tax=Neolewinella aquimaris TaxID=1835722 RepID=A0A840EA49_9BACT|nr:HD domain-containing protein [Neolewinella aquimaris]MBB4078689.1 putative metal-dependent HD superfamily phosphohydrolase [Neolewinella aquimaris]
MKKQKRITQRASRYVTRRLIRELPHNRIFHNIHHTLTVWRGTKMIGKAMGLSKEELEIVCLAAIFHDTGHIECYVGHEEVSVRIAREWLEKQGYPPAKIDRVSDCIRATSMPQDPRNKLEQVLCDADLLHLSFEAYPDYQEMLRREWQLEFGLKYTDEDWELTNNTFLADHKYFTDYARQELEPRKQQLKVD